MTPRLCDAGSFSVKYRCPMFQTLQLESSPSTHTSKNWVSSRSRTPTFSSVTLRIRREGAGSSSNGSSNRSFIEGPGELFELLVTVAQALDVRRESAPLVRVHDDGVEARVPRGGLEARRHGIEKTAERCLDLHANDGIMRAGHAHIRQVRGSLRQDALIGRLHMRVRTHDRRHPAV